MNELILLLKDRIRNIDAAIQYEIDSQNGNYKHILALVRERRQNKRLLKRLEKEAAL